MWRHAPWTIIATLVALVLLAVAVTWQLGNPLGHSTRQVQWVANAHTGSVRIVASVPRDDLQGMAASAEQFTQGIERWLGFGRQPLTIAMLENRRAYQDFAASRVPGFHPRMDYCYSPAMRMIVGYNDSSEGERRRLQHEIFHHLSYSSRSLRMPLWLEEGVAELSEGMVIDSDGYLVLQEIQNDHLRHAARLIFRGRGNPLADILNGDRSTLASNPVGFYGVSYALALYLLHRDELDDAVIRGNWTAASDQRDDFRSFLRRSGDHQALIGSQLRPRMVASTP